MNIKVCGITQLKQLQQLDGLNIDFAGFIFHKESPRYVVGKISREELQATDFDVKKVGVFVNAAEEDIMTQVEDFGLDIVQLHGDETPGFCNHISNHVTVIKAFRITATNEQNIDWMIKPYEEYCDFYLFDTNRKNAYGGTGEKFDWKILTKNKINKPFFLSGGIGLNDVERLNAFEHPFFFAVDVNSKVEIAEGIKDIDVIRKLAHGLLIK